MRLEGFTKPKFWCPRFLFQRLKKQVVGGLGLWRVFPNHTSIQSFFEDLCSKASNSVEGSLLILCTLAVQQIFLFLHAFFSHFINCELFIKGIHTQECEWLYQNPHS